MWKPLSSGSRVISQPAVMLRSRFGSMGYAIAWHETAQASAAHTTRRRARLISSPRFTSHGHDSTLLAASAGRLENSGFSVDASSVGPGCGRGIRKGVGSAQLGVTNCLRSRTTGRWSRSSRHHRAARGGCCRGLPAEPGSAAIGTPCVPIGPWLGRDLPKCHWPTFSLGPRGHLGEPLYGLFLAERS